MYFGWNKPRFQNFQSQINRNAMASICLRDSFFLLNPINP